MVFIYAAGVISAAVLIGVLVYLSRESAAVDKKRQVDTPPAEISPEGEQEGVAVEQDLKEPDSGPAEGGQEGVAAEQDLNS